MEITPEDKKKAARKEYLKQYYIKNLERIKARQKIYEAKNAKEIREYKKKYRVKNAEHFKKYRAENSEHKKDYDAKYYTEHVEDIKAQKKIYSAENAEYIKDYKKKHYIENAENIKEKAKNYARIRLKHDPTFRMISTMRNRLRDFFKSSNIKKTNKTFDMVGCTPEFLMEHLESQFKDGMTRENYGFKGWHIDHIIPLASAGTDIEKAEKLCHYTNLQPLWWWENFSKGDKIALCG